MYDFKFKPFDEMTPEDYARVGFKSGLEVHQQLLTDKKLFCRCPAGHYNRNFNAEILRHMRPTLSELGEYDGTALMEFKTKKDIIYRINYETVCTYEMDDTPPFMINDQALDISIEIGMLMNCSIVDELHIARKQYLDGSIPTGFQRTAITSLNGWIPYKDRKINIIQMSIEEDSCREHSDEGHTRVYLTDRLGMPLIETVTAPDMKTPNEVAEVNEILRRIARSTGHVRTGVGAGREDVNVSVTGGTRIEIKGVPSIKRIPLLTYNEAMRQWNLLRLREELKNRGITPETFEAKIDDISHLLRNTSYKPLYDSIHENKIVKCVTLRGFKGLLSWQTQTDTYFAKEISDRVRVIACLTTLPNIIHSDSSELTLSSSEGQKIRKFVGANEEKDTLVIVWGSKEDAEMAANEIVIRAKEATIGIPSETRQALRDGTNGFERILPGPDRMYPDTDLPPKKITDERKSTIRANIPEFLWERESYYRKSGVPEDIINGLAVSRFAPLMKKVVEELKIPASIAATAIMNYPKLLNKKGYDTNILKNTEYLYEIFKSYADKQIVKDGIFVSMENLIKAGAMHNDIYPKPADAKEIKLAIMEAVDKVLKMKLYDEKNRRNLILGTAMSTLRGRAEAKMVDKIIDENYNKEL